MNILLLAAGTRNKIVQYFKAAFADGGRVVAADASAWAPALYEADAHYLVPPISAPTYVDAVLDICQRERIAGVLSLIDTDLSLLAAHAPQFAALGTTVIGSSRQLCDMAMDKYAMYQWLEAHGYPCVRSWVSLPAFCRAVDAGEAAFPAFVKPVRGSGSINAAKASDRAMAQAMFDHMGGLMIQPFVDGQEIGADVYADLISGEVVSIFTKQKVRMRAGETDKAISFKDPALFDLIARFVAHAGFRGPLDIDLFYADGRYYIAEVNPRFGGGYPHAYACGCDHMRLILQNLRGVVNEAHIGDYQAGVRMMKYNDVMVLPEGQ